MAVVDIAVLGPLEVRGDAAGLSPRDRTVLAALAVETGRVVSVERLADALWGGSPPASWNKVVPGCVMRLRRLLGVDAIQTVGSGYRLTLAPDEVDFLRFERLVHRGRELLELREAERAQYTFDQALQLWRGAPLSDLAEWEPGRIEANRLDELRQDAQECRLDAALRAGRSGEVIPDAQRGVAQAPLRERRWALLARAQYQCGQQGEALRTLQRARTVLVSELGLDPGPELTSLEQAILQHDPSLVVEATAAVAAWACPWPGLAAYGIDDADAFFGRDSEITACLDRLATSGSLLITGPSGSGKSSLARAGVAAGLAGGGRPVVLTPGADPVAALAADTPRAGQLLVVDQAEELFTLTRDATARDEFLEQLIRHSARGPLLIVLRADHLGDLAGYPRFARVAEREIYLLGPLTEPGLRAAVEQPARQAGLLLEPGLVDLLVQEVQGKPGALPLLSHALQRTWERREGRTLTVAGYRAGGGIRGSIALSAEQLYQSLPAAQQTRLRQLLLRLVSATDDYDAIRTRVPRDELAGDPDRQQLLDALTAARLITTDRNAVEVAHECLARAWPRLRGWLDDDVEGHRIMRHLSGAAQTWQQMGRPDSELYRGVRLTQALAWAQHSTPDLTPTERDFLTCAQEARSAEAHAAEQAARARTRSRRRNRLILGATVGLVIVALVAAGLAVRQQQARDAAEQAALATEASRVDDAARTASGLDQALLYAVQAVRIHDAPETRAVLLDLLSQHPALIRSIRTGPVHALDTSPDGTTLVVGTDSSTDGYDTVTYHPEQNLHIAAGSAAVKFSPDGQQITMVAALATGYAEANNELSAQTVDVATGASTRPVLDGVTGRWVYAQDVSYSGDGRRIAAYAIGAGDDWSTGIEDAASAVWDVADTTAPLAVWHQQFWALALSRDGTRLYVGTTQDMPTLSVLDVATGQTVQSTPVPRARVLAPSLDHPSDGWTMLVNGIQVSPDGSTVAVAEGTDIGLYEAATLTKIADLKQHTGPVRTLRFSADGRFLASGADDGLAIVWDMTTHAPTAVLTGHTGAVRAVAFAPDGRTLYSGGDDQQTLVWDLDGDRRFVTVAVHPDPIGRSAAAVPAPDGATVVNVGRGTDQPAVRFLDVTSATLGPHLSDPDGADLAQWLPPDNNRVATVGGNQVRIWDRATGHQMLSRTVADTTITALAAPTATALVVADANGTVLRLDPASLDPTGPAIRLGHRITALTGPADGPTAIALMDDQHAAKVDLTTGTTLASHDLGLQVTAAAVSPDGRRLAVGGRAGQVGMFDLQGGSWLTTPTDDHQLYVTSIQFTGDGTLFTTATLDSHIALWDGTSGQLIGRITAGTVGSPARAVIPPNDADVLIASRDRGVYRWSTHPADWLSYACHIAGRNLTITEWHAVLQGRPYTDTCVLS